MAERWRSDEHGGMKTSRLWLFLAAALLPVAASPAPQTDEVTLHGVVFTQVRTGADGIHIGRIDTETVVGDRPCRPGWLHLHPDGTPAAFTAAHDITFPRFTIPAGTWVRQDAAGTITDCAFPRDTVVQGHACRGTGGPKGVQTAFYPDGALRQFFPVEATVIDGVPCAPGLRRGAVELHPDGRLKSCLLARDHVIAGVKHRKGARLHLNPDGSVRR